MDNNIDISKMNVNLSFNSDLLHEMGVELDRAEKTKQTEMEYISDVSEKSNNILLLIEASQKRKPVPFQTTSKRLQHSKDMLHHLAKTVQDLERITSQDVDKAQQQPSGSGAAVALESFITSRRAKIDLLKSSVRKLLALNDKVYQIGSELGFGSDSELESDTSCNEEDLVSYEQ